MSRANRWLPGSVTPKPYDLRAKPSTSSTHCTGTSIPFAQADHGHPSPRRLSAIAGSQRSGGALTEQPGGVSTGNRAGAITSAYRPIVNEPWLGVRDGSKAPATNEQTLLPPPSLRNCVHMPSGPSVDLSAEAQERTDSALSSIAINNKCVGEQSMRPPHARLNPMSG